MARTLRRGTGRESLWKTACQVQFYGFAPKEIHGHNIKHNKSFCNESIRSVDASELIAVFFFKKA